eukprot:TRINITY_DN1688_c2_g1_i1.p1 TRINITY_DN1688_c2_g1~~TRINITY_DN1688_c2_g1_i1.p1  ORF type:complete len:202 (-),score=38.57 TRINITY_DN1688_c2_g1_i1:149-754(-)
MECSALLEEEQFFFMGEALKEAEEAAKSGEIPVGCVILGSDKNILARGANQTVVTANATRHAELVAIDRILSAQKKISKSSSPIDKKDSMVTTDDCDHPKPLLHGCVLVVTVEPCIMCAAALLLLGIGHVYFGCRNPRFGGCGTVHEVNSMHDHGYACTEGVRAEEAIAMLQTFYDGENFNAPVEKRKVKGQKVGGSDADP